MIERRPPGGAVTVFASGGRCVWEDSGTSDGGERSGMWAGRIGSTGDVGGNEDPVVRDDCGAVEPETLDKFLFLREFGFVWIRECLVSSSEREKRLLQPANEHE